MTTPILSKLIAAGLSAALGGAGLFAAAPESPLTPSPSGNAQLSTVSFAGAHDAPAIDPGMANLLSRVDPAVLRDPEVAAALRDPRVVSVLSDAEVQRALEGIDPAVLTRPAVLEAIAARRVTPDALADPVVQANLPAILSALPTLRAAYERADAGPGTVEPAAQTSEIELTPTPAAPSEPAPLAGLPAETLPVDALPALLAATSELANAPELEALPPSVMPALVATAVELAPALEGGEVDAEAVATIALPVLLDVATELLSAQERRPGAREARDTRRNHRSLSNRGSEHRSERANDVLSQLYGLGLQVAANTGR